MNAERIEEVTHKLLAASQGQEIGDILAAAAYLVASSFVDLHLPESEDYSLIMEHAALISNALKFLRSEMKNDAH